MTGPLIAVWSPKGGVGKTLIAAGLAMHLHRRTGRETMLIDLDAGKADLATLLQVSPRPSILDYPAGISGAVQHPTGLRVLPGPARLVDEGMVTGELAGAVLDKALGEGHLVVADVDATLRDSTLVTLERADVVLLVTTPDLLTLSPSRRFVQEAELIGLDLARFRVVINRATPRQEIPDREILDLLGLPLAGRVPSLPGLAAAVNHGLIGATARQNSEFGAAMHIIAEKLEFAGVAPPATPMATVTRPLELAPAGLLPAIRRWWQNL